MSEFLDVAIEAIQKSSELTKSYFQTNLNVEIKKDKSPVTKADRESEIIIKEIINNHFPTHSIYGEEYGFDEKDNEFTWIIDPIDGTKNYIDGIPLWGTLIALMRKGEIILGLSSMPMIDELLYAEVGEEAYLNGDKVHVSEFETVDQCMLSFGSLGAFQEKQYEQGLMDLIKASRRQRSFGDCYPYHLLASGKLDIVCEAAIKVVDVAPFSLIIKEAGGYASDIKGRPLDMNINSFLATNGKVHNDVLKFFNSEI
jgi:histidinol-phosphatase